jgi:benzaldehyde dehydrogenase (NAD)
VAGSGIHRRRVPPSPQDEALAPFGGIGQSGLGGRSGGDANIEEFTERRWLTVNTEPAHYPY